MTYTIDPRVDAYIDALPDWQAAICREIRELVHAADPQVVETIKRRDRPYFVLEGNICALLATKDHVNVFLYDGGIVPDPEGIITGGLDNKTARTVAVYRGKPVNAAALTSIFRQIIAHNRAGGWRRIKTVDPSTDTEAGGLRSAPVDAREVEAAWAILRQALPEGWRVREPVYDPDGRQWSVWAVSKPPIKVMPVRGGGSTEAEALVNLAATLHARHPRSGR